MEKGVEKFFRKLIMSKYPMYLDVYVRPFIEGSRRYEVYLVINVKDFREDMYNEIAEYVRTIAKYMNVEVMGLYNDVVYDD